MRKLCNCDGKKEECADCNIYEPNYAGEVPYVPVAWGHRDDITARLLQIVEAILPEGKQLEATKHLVKDTTKKYWIELFNNQYDCLPYRPGEDALGGSWGDYCQAIWDEAQKHKPIEDPYQASKK